MYEPLVGTCQASNCENQFTLHPQGQGKRFCSEKCRRSSLKPTREFTCARVACGKTYLSFETKSKFCSKSCAAIEHNTGRIKREYENCLKCENSLRGTNGKKFCSNKCAKQYHRDGYLRDWIAGQTPLSKANGELSYAARNYLVQQAGGRCKCGWGEINPVLGYAVLTVNHIDGNSHNNMIENLEVLCYNCHTLTPTFGNLNAGNGRTAQAKKLQGILR